MSDCYDPEKSRISEDTLANFLRATLTGDLTEVPGISRCAVRQLGSGDEKITNSFQLIGKFLSLKTNIKKTNKMISVIEHCNVFNEWLTSKGIYSHCVGITMAIAEKTNTMIPGMYDPDEFN